MTVTEIKKGIVIAGSSIEQTIKTQLDRLTELQAEFSEVEQSEDELIRDAIPADVQKQIASIRGVHTKKKNKLDKDIEATIKTIKALTLNHGSTVSGDGHMAVYSSPRKSWDSSKLEGYLIANDQSPDDFRTIGNPSISIRAVAKK